MFKNHWEKQTNTHTQKTHWKMQKSKGQVRWLTALSFLLAFRNREAAVSPICNGKQPTTANGHNCLQHQGGCL